MSQVRRDLGSIINEPLRSFLRVNLLGKPPPRYADTQLFGALRGVALHGMAWRGIAWQGMAWLWHCTAWLLPDSDLGLDCDFSIKIVKDIVRISVLQLVSTFSNEIAFRKYKSGKCGN